MSAYGRTRRDRVEPLEARRRYLMGELNRVGVIVSPSAFTRELYIRAGVDERRIVVIEKGSDLPAAASPVIRPDGRLRIGYVGQIVPHKGVELLVLALRRMPQVDLEVRIHGNPAPFPHYAAKLRRLAGGDRRIVFAGAFPRSERDRVYSELDAVVVPSLWYENSPNVIHEALAHRTPVIAADLGSMRELVEHGRNGLRFAPGDAASLAEQLLRLAAEPSLVNTLRAGIGPVRPAAREVEDLEALYLDLPRVAG
jgi:glycosyltransferase involved in cell wall biosynthesis